MRGLAVTTAATVTTLTLGAFSPAALADAPDVPVSAQTRVADAADAAEAAQREAQEATRVAEEAAQVAERSTIEADAAEAHYDSTRAGVGEVAAAMYRNSPLPHSPTVRIVTSTDPTAALSDASSVASYANRVDSIIGASRAAQDRAERTAATEAQAAQAAQVAADEAQAEAAEADRALADAKQALAAAERDAQSSRNHAPGTSTVNIESQRGATPTGGGLSLPTIGPITSPYGLRVHPVTGVRKLHTGTDFSAPCGTGVPSAAAGTVTSTGWAGAYGQRVEITHPQGLVTTYSHLSAIEVGTGDQVDTRQRVGRVGTTGSSTGCHLHFEVMVGGEYANPMGWS